MTEFVFDDWITSLHLADETVDKLRAAKVRNVESVLSLSQYDITAVKIDIGDRSIFRKAIKRLRIQFPDDEVDEGAGIDDSFDGNDPDHLAVQQNLQVESLRKLQADQEALSLQQAEQLHAGAASTPSITVSHQSCIEQLSSLLGTLQLTLVPATDGLALQQPLISRPAPLSGTGGVSPLSSQALPGAAFFGGPVLPTGTHPAYSVQNPAASLGTVVDYHLQDCQLQRQSRLILRYLLV
jgi:hypothetical protein